MNSITCPFCNAMIPLPQNGVPQGKIPCSRCGEMVTIRGLGSNISPPQTAENAPNLENSLPPDSTRPPLATAPTNSLTSLQNEVERQRRQRHQWAEWSVRRTIIVCASLGILGLIVGFGMTQLRKKGDKPKDTGEPIGPRMVAPTELPGLAYLPDKTDFLLAIHLPALIQTLSEDEAKTPRAALMRLGLPDGVIDLIEQGSGVGLEQIDQLLLGIAFPKGTPRAVLIVHTRQPYDIDNLAKKTKAISQRKEGRTVYSVKLPSSFPSEMHWWSANRRILVATFLAKDFESVPTDPRKGTAHLPPALVESMKNRVQPDAIVWSVAESDQWEGIVGPFLLLSGRGDLSKSLTDLRSWTLQIRREETFTVGGWIDLKSESVAETLRNRLTEQWKDDERVQIGGSQNTCFVRLPFDSTGLRSIFAKVLPEPAKKK